MSHRRLPPRRMLGAALLLASAPLFAQQMHSPFSNLVFIGDSLTDSGHFRPALVQAYGPNAAMLGRFTTNPGFVWSDWLARHYGLDATSANQGGDNHAVGGARNGVDTSGALGAIPSLATQATRHLAAGSGRADPNALYTVWGGANDLFAVTAGAPAQATIGGAVAAQVGIVAQLQAAGARYVMVPNIPDLGLTPGFRAQGAAAAGQGTALSVAFNTALYGTLAGQGLRVIPLDTFSLLREITADPARWGFTNVTGTACQPQITAQSISCEPGSYVVPNAGETYAFADGVHPTMAAHEVIADYALGVIEGPRQMAALPHAAVMTGRMRAQQVAAEIAAPREEGSRWWAGVRYDGHAQELDRRTDLYDASGPSLTIGLDRAAGNVVYGGFLGHGRQSADWGRDRGDYTQTDTSLGGYLGWRSGNGWINGQLSHTRLGLETRRHAVLGRSGRVHHGSADGRNLAVALEGGWELGDGTLRHGPLLGVTAQQVRIDGFAESDPSLSTALAFAEQRVDSLVASAGWQVRYDAGSVQPFARLSWDRETRDSAGQAFASLQSIPDALPYAVPGLSFDRSHGTATAGARFRLGGVAMTGGASVLLGHRDGQHVGVFLNVGSGL